MARKKAERKADIVQYEPSKYQKDIFDFIQHKQGNLVIEAAAGSGKTWTLCKCIELLPPDSKILFAAFNNDITNELKKKLANVKNARVNTLHSLGKTILMRNYAKEHELELSDMKYIPYVRKNAINLSSANELSKQETTKFIKNVIDLVNFGRLYLATCVVDMYVVAERYRIDMIADEAEVALKVMDWGKQELDIIDFTDMIWIPYANSLSSRGLTYDYIFIDEAQDLSKAQRYIIGLLSSMKTRIIAAGCQEQTIYSFNGADPQSFDEFKSMPNTSSLPLSISYRCADRIVEYAQRWGTIEKNDNGIDGEIEYNSEVSDIEEGSMVLCRNNAPLMKVYADLVRAKKKCVILGKDFTENIVDSIMSTGMAKLNIGLTEDGVFVRLYDELFNYGYSLMEKYGLDKKMAFSSEQFMNKFDKIRALEILSVGLETREQLINKIMGLQTKNDENDKSIIRLSTIHKAKGLEADNVYIVCNSLMPSKSAVKDWEKNQEKCLMYVAYTRPKLKLSFLDEEPFKVFQSDQTDIKLMMSEIKVNKVLGKQAREIKVTKENADTVIAMAKPVIDTKKSEPVRLSSTGTSAPKTFGGIIKRKKTKLRHA